MRIFFTGILYFVLYLFFSTSCKTELEEAVSEVNVTVKEEDCYEGYDTAYGKWLTNKAAKIDSFFTSKYERDQFNGTILFADRGRVIIKKAYGFANLKKKDSLSLSSSFQLASISKPLTALAILWLEENNYLALEDSLQTYFPNFPYQDITISMLLSHRSGLPNYMYFSEKLWADSSIPITNQDVVCLMETYHPDRYYIPNYRYNYSNTNYALLAAIVENISGMHFGQFMDRYIFDAVGMSESFVYSKKSANASDFNTIGYHRGRIAEDNYLNGVTGDKGVYSSVEDLFKLDQALYSEDLISERSINAAFTAANSELYDHDNYGLGWRINEGKDGSKIVFHSGWWKGYRTHFFRLLDRKQTIIVLSNTNRSRFIKTNDLLCLLD